MRGKTGIDLIPWPESHQVPIIFPRVILLLLNAFDLEEGSLTADNLNEMKEYLMATYPQEYAQLSPQLKNCSLEAELDTVSHRLVLALGLRSLLSSHRAQAAPQLHTGTSTPRGAAWPGAYFCTLGWAGRHWLNWARGSFGSLATETGGDAAGVLAASAGQGRSQRYGANVFTVSRTVPVSVQFE